MRGDFTLKIVMFGFDVDKAKRQNKRTKKTSNIERRKWPLSTITEA